MSYPVIKWVKGNPYLYIQESYRVGGNPRTRTIQYLGRASALDVVRILHKRGLSEDFPIQAGQFRQGKFTSQKPLSETKSLDIQTDYERNNIPDFTFSGPDDLTLMVIDELEGKKYVSRQFVEDLLKAPALKEIERQIVEDILEEMPGRKLPVDLFCGRVENELLPLNAACLENTRWDEYQLPEGYGNESYHYEEFIYQSPIQTLAGKSHFSGIEAGDNYFAHVRAQTDHSLGVRRILEIQSDFFQQNRRPEQFDDKEGFDRLKPYRNNWWQRVIREEIKKAAQEGIEHFYFPTAHTSAVIERFCSLNEPITHEDIGYDVEIGRSDYTVLDCNNTGALVIEPDGIFGQHSWDDVRNNEIDHLVDDIREDPKNYPNWKGSVEDEEALRSFAEDLFEKEHPTADHWADYATENYGEGHITVPSRWGGTDIIRYNNDYAFWHSNEEGDPFDPDTLEEDQLRVVNFYDKDIPKYLKKAGHDAFEEHDYYGVSWWRVDISPSDDKPIRAY